MDFAGFVVVNVVNAVVEFKPGHIYSGLGICVENSSYWIF